MLSGPQPKRPHTRAAWGRLLADGPGWLFLFVPQKRLAPWWNEDCGPWHYVVQLVSVMGGEKNAYP